VLANRLSQSGKNNVLILEAGSNDNDWKIQMPAALMYNLRNDRYNWYYHTEHQTYLNNRKLYWPRGKVWGGSSSLNAMVYVRGHANDYNRWAKDEGAIGWNYENILPYFKKAETREIGGDLYRGNDGPLHVSTGKMQNILHQVFLNAGQQAGLPYTSDMNGYQQFGVGPMDMTVYKGKRFSTSSAYLKPALLRKNCNIISNILVKKIIFNGTTAKGIEYLYKGKTYCIFANKEIILSCGAINSPQLLMLSGIGNSNNLKDVGIDTINHLPGVGENLQDHLEIYVQYQCKKPVTLYKYNKFPFMQIAGIEWFLNKTGICTSSHLESGGFACTLPGGQTQPNIQIHFIPSKVVDHGRGKIDAHCFQVHIGPMRPKSKGFIKLKSNNIYDYPIIQPNYLQDPYDLEEMRQSIMIAREIFNQSAFNEYRGDELRPGSKENIDNFIKEYADSAYHPSCTCKMGQETDEMSVVNENGIVYGCENLRIVDASIMPSIVSGNLNAPVIMMAEKIADNILNNKMLTPINAPVYNFNLDK
jgi:choline dehydrogenase